MNAAEIITEVIDTVDDYAYSSRSLILKYVNSSQLLIASRLMLPDLNNGLDTVQTVIDGHTVPVPEDYHKGLYMASVGGVGLDIHKTPTDQMLSRGPLDDEEGDVTDVSVAAKTVHYQNVPGVSVDIMLGYYRLPVEMDDSETTYPDGAIGFEEFSWAIIHHSCHVLFNKVEDGMQGAKVNTQAHKALFDEKMFLLEAYAFGQGHLVPMRPAQKRRFLGEK